MERGQYEDATELQQGIVEEEEDASSSMEAMSAFWPRPCPTRTHLGGGIRWAFARDIGWSWSSRL